MPDRWHTRFSIVRSAVSSPCVGASTTSSAPPGLQPGAVLDAMLHLVAVGAEHLVEHQQRDVDPGDHPRLTGDHRRGRRRVGGHRRQRGDVGPVAQVLFEGARDHRAGLGQLVGSRVPSASSFSSTPSAGTRLRACGRVGVGEVANGGGSRAIRCAPGPRPRPRRHGGQRDVLEVGCASSRIRGVEASSSLASRREAVAVAHHRRVPRHRPLQIGARQRTPARRFGGDTACVGPASTAWSAAARARPAADDQAFEQAVGRQPVRAVHAGARHLARGEQAREFGAPVHIGDDAAAAVVRAGHHRDRLRASDRYPRPGTPR